MWALLCKHAVHLLATVDGDIMLCRWTAVL